jgi:hypothetical protein
MTFDKASIFNIADIATTLIQKEFYLIMVYICISLITYKK